MLDFFKNKNNKVLVNTSIHEKAKLSKDDFLNRVSSIEGLRTWYDEISLFIANEELHYFLTDLWRLVNDGDFRLRIFPNYVIFVVVIENNYYNWFKNTSLELIKKQICNYISAYCLAFPDFKYKIINSLYEPYRNEVEFIIKNFYSSDFDKKYTFNSVGTNNAEQHRMLTIDRISEYKSASLKYINCPPPLELQNPFELKTSIHAFRNVDSAFLKINIQSCYIRNDDWLSIIVRDAEKLADYYGVNSGKSQFNSDDIKNYLKQAEDDIMMRSESNTEPWKIWLGMFNDSENYITNIFDPIGNDLTGGFVYLIKEDETHNYKIGYTQMESGVPIRKAGNQTGNPRSLILKGYFPVSSKKTESVLHNHFKSFRKTGEWFELSEHQVNNILSEEWRLDNHIF